MTTDLSTHPLVQHYLTILRERSTQASEFRTCRKRITEVIMVEANKQLSLDHASSNSLEIADGARLSPGVVFVPILRAGLGMLDPAMGVIPGSSVGYIGWSETKLQPKQRYYAKMPDFRPALKYSS